MGAFLEMREAVGGALRGEVGGEVGETRLKLRWLLVAGVVFGVTYGGVMGSFWGEGGMGSVRGWQMVYSGVKVPMLLGIAFGVAMPSFFVLNTLLGVREDFGRVMRALGATQAAVSAVLVSLAPLTLFWYASFGGYEAAVTVNGVMFLVASLAGQSVLRRQYKPLIEKNKVHRWLLVIWLVLYGFVGVQMGWVLRPFIGSPGRPTQFFREGAWGNAYVEVGRVVWTGVTGRRGR